MAGFKRTKTLDISWQPDHELHGLEVKMRPLSIGKMASFAGLADLRKQGADTANSLKIFEDITETMAESLASWNLEDDSDQPVPATLDGIRAQDMDLVFEILSAWMDLAVGVSDPLSRTSSDGPPSLEASLPMEPLSPNPAN